MSYTEFITKYPCIGLFLELFKGIMPTIVALLAIYINNKRASKRERKKMITDMKLKSLLSLQDSAIDVHNMVYNTGKEFLDYMQYLEEKEKSEAYFNNFYENNKTMLIAARKLMLLSEAEKAKLDIDNISFYDCFHKVSKFPNEIMNIMRRYDSKAKVTSKDKFDELLDIVQQELIKVSESVEDEIIKYIKTLGQIINEMYT